MWLAWALLLGPVGAKFAYEGFRQHPSLNIAGDAAVAVDELWLTPSAAQSAGAAYFARAQDISIGFVTEFEFDMSVHEGERGEGFAFVAQQDDPFQLGSPGPSLGYGGITNGFAVEFDAHKDEDMGDPDAGHVSIHLCVPGAPRSARRAPTRRLPTRDPAQERRRVAAVGGRGRREPGAPDSAPRHQAAPRSRGVQPPQLERVLLQPGPVAAPAGARAHGGRGAPLRRALGGVHRVHKCARRSPARLSAVGAAPTPSPRRRRAAGRVEARGPELVL